VIVKIQVTDQDIAHGLAGDCEECPIALAIYRALSATAGIRVGTGGVTLYRDHANAMVALPAAASRFISRFDHDDLVEPFEFDLDVPDELVPAGAS
jgi:alpha-ketoglutarate-dependent taurine dioxygenase